MRPRISVLIATCDRAALLRKCLAALLGNTVAPDEIWIADQSSGSETESAARAADPGRSRVRYLRLERRGKSRALNEAIRASSGELLALTDDDVEVDRRWIETIGDLGAKEPQAAAFCGRVLPEPGTDPAGYHNLVLGTRRRSITRWTNPLSTGFCGANVVVRRSAMLEVGGYNVHFGPGALFRNNDDGDLAYRLVRGGLGVLFVPELVVYHSGWRLGVDNDDQLLEYCHSLGAFAGYYLRRGQPRPALFLTKKGLFKSRQLVAGLFVGNAAKVGEARIQLRGLRGGFFQGFMMAP